jgi:glycosyltransferase involved in cell wall biosynthesis
MHFALEVACKAVAWLVALAWVTRIVAAHRGLPTVPNLLLPEFDLTPSGAPSLTVIVPARNEERDVGGCLESLLAQEYPVQVMAVNDRSTDGTGAVMDALAAANPGHLRVLHIAELPAGWLGKTHAMAVAARSVDSEFLLFTDADVLFHPAALRRALANAQTTGADHLVVYPTTIIRRWDEAALLSFFQIFGLWAARPWQVANPRSVRDAIGIGAFNLIRRSAYERIGGFEGFPMEIVEDLGLGRRVKQAGLRQRVAFGRGLVSVHWASGVRGLIGVMTKNVFSVFNFHVSLLLLMCLWILVFMVVPFAGVLFPGVALASALAIVAMFYGYWLMGGLSGLSAWNAWLAPFAGSLLIYTLLRSMVTTVWQGGVIWRGTFYSLAELRRNTAPLLRRKNKA